jgi:hypothetical protein
MFERGKYFTHQDFIKNMPMIKDQCNLTEELFHQFDDLYTELPNFTVSTDNFANTNIHVVPEKKDFSERDALAKRIMKFHPGYGVDLGLSHYTGGHVDSGDWYFERLVKMKQEELVSLLAKLIQRNPNG